MADSVTVTDCSVCVPVEAEVAGTVYTPLCLYVTSGDFFVVAIVVNVVVVTCIGLKVSGEVEAGNVVALKCVVNISIVVTILSAFCGTVNLVGSNVVGISAGVLPVPIPGTTGDVSSGNCVVCE